MNKKGFTLVELLAVIVVIGIISTIAVVSMGGIRNRVDLKLVEGNLNLILTAARNVGEQDLNRLAITQDDMTVSTLKSLTELDLDSSYDNIIVRIFLKNRRASACIVNSDSLVSIVGEDNIDSFNKYYCDTSSTNSIIKGDVDGNGVVNCSDVNLLRQYLADNKTPIASGNADINNDTIIDTTDLTALLDYIPASTGAKCE